MQLATDEERARRRDEREHEMIAALALIAPTPELVRQVLALRDVDEPRRTVVIDIVPDRESVTAKR